MNLNSESNHSISTTLKGVKRVVIKIGTRVIDDEQSHFNRPIMTALVKEIAELKHKGIEVLLVSSGAVGMGLRSLGVSKRPASIHLRQAYAAIGQNKLMNLYSELFAEYDLKTAQILLTRSDLDRRESYLNAEAALNHLLALGIIPIINENDTVSIKELQFGDNDFLASLVAGKMNADWLILLTTVDGIYRSFDPKTKQGELIEIIDNNWKEVSGHINHNLDPLSMGGMQTKIEAARTASSKGVLVCIANGLKKGILTDLMSGEANSTWVIPQKKKMAAWKYYLAFAKRLSGGKITIDSGAVSAICNGGNSLLASGVVSIDGTFKPKDLVQIVDESGHEVARGLVNYSSQDLKKIQGHSTKNIKDLIKKEKPKAVIHRDNLVVIE